MRIFVLCLIIYDWILWVEPEGSKMLICFANNNIGENRIAKVIFKSNNQEIDDCYLKLTQGSNGKSWLFVDEQ